MRILVLSDIHGDTDSLEQILRRQDEAADLILVLGDITDVGLDDYLGQAKAVLDLLEEHATFIKAVPGNMDDETILKELIERRINLHKQVFSMEDADFIGFGGGDTPFDTPFEPDDGEREEVIRALLGRTKAEQRIVVSHMPPRGTSIDRTADDEHVGSPGLRRIIDEETIDCVLSGHIHEARGVDRVGETLCLNPGPVKNGAYAVVEVDADDIRFELS